MSVYLELMDFQPVKVSGKLWPFYCENSKIQLSECKCNYGGTNGDASCDETGLCNCKPNVVGQKCTQCKSGYYRFPECTCNLFSLEHMLPSKLTFFFALACGCHTDGYTGCDSKSGTCYCKAGYTGPKCEKCSVGYFGFPNCQSILVLIKV